VIQLIINNELNYSTHIREVMARTTNVKALVLVGFLLVVLPFHALTVCELVVKTYTEAVFNYRNAAAMEQHRLLFATRPGLSNPFDSSELCVEHFNYEAVGVSLPEDEPDEFSLSFTIILSPSDGCKIVASLVILIGLVYNLLCRVHCLYYKWRYSHVVNSAVHKASLVKDSNGNYCFQVMVGTKLEKVYVSDYSVLKLGLSDIEVKPQKSLLEMACRGSTMHRLSSPPKGVVAIHRSEPGTPLMEDFGVGCRVRVGSEDYLLTARHVVAKPGKIYLRAGKTDIHLQGELFCQSPVDQLDFVLIKVPNAIWSSLGVAVLKGTSSIKKGAVASFYTVTADGAWYMSMGEVRKGIAPKRLLHDASTQFGSSGSPGMIGGAVAMVHTRRRPKLELNEGTDLTSMFRKTAWLFETPVPTNLWETAEEYEEAEERYDAWLEERIERELAEEDRVNSIMYGSHVEHFMGDDAALYSLKADYDSADDESDLEENDTGRAHLNPGVYNPRAYRPALGIDWADYPDEEFDALNEVSRKPKQKQKQKQSDLELSRDPQPFRQGVWRDPRHLNSQNSNGLSQESLPTPATTSQTSDTQCVVLQEGAEERRKKQPPKPNPQLEDSGTGLGLPEERKHCLPPSVDRPAAASLESYPAMQTENVLWSPYARNTLRLRSQRGSGRGRWMNRSFARGA